MKALSALSTVAGLALDVAERSVRDRQEEGLTQ